MPETNGPRKKRQDIVIDGQAIAAGEKSIINLDVGRLPSDTRIFVNLHVFHSKKPGPVVLILGGVHGDEINGVEVVRRSLDMGLFENLLRGTVIAIPLLNVYGFINFSREVPDGKDVNRSFPGSMRGSLASRVARMLTKFVLPKVDFILDFHTGGASRYNYPQVRCTKGDKESLHLASIFNPPFIIYKPVLTRSLRKIARIKKMPMLIFEGGEALRLDGFSITKGLRGLRRILTFKNMIEGKLSPPNRSILIRRTLWVRAATSGIFTWTKSSGARVRKGEPLGIIYDPSGTKRVVVQANRDGFVIGHNNAPVVNQGDALFNIGYQFEEVDLSEISV